jgi:phosphoglycerate dehydrogenase-like enzyme
MSPKILVVSPSAEVSEIAREMAPKGFETIVVSDAEVTAALPGTEYMVCYPHVPMRDAFYKAVPKLKLVQLLSAGYDNVDLEAARRAKVPLSNNGGANAISVSEHALMLMLTVYRKVIWQHGSVSGGRWRGNGPAPRMYELYDKTLGIIGFGTIGKKVARLARAFGMHVQYFDIARLSEDEADQHGVKFRLLRELLRSSDVVSLHVPLNDSTRHMIGAEELALMKPTSIIINTSRGPVIDEKALHAALTAGKIFGAGLDVFDQEPPPTDNPLFRLDNVVLTAHFAGPTWDNHVARFRNAFDNVQRVARGEPALWVVPELAG